jgi:hypothetical protein
MKRKEDLRQQILNGQTEQGRLQSEKKKLKAIEMRDFHSEAKVDRKFKAEQ